MPPDQTRFEIECFMATLAQTQSVELQTAARHAMGMHKILNQLLARIIELEAK